MHIIVHWAEKTPVMVYPPHILKAIAFFLFLFLFKEKKYENTIFYRCLQPLYLIADFVTDCVLSSVSPAYIYISIISVLHLPSVISVPRV